MAEQQLTHRKELIGIVTSDKMDRTVVVQVTTFKRHPLYHKRYRWTKKYLADTGVFSPKIGDLVKIQSTRPMSKLKRWVVVEVLQANAEVMEVVAGQIEAEEPAAEK